MKNIKITNQEAMDYTLYMIAGSYFDKAVCRRGRYQESRLFLYYKEQNNEIQYLMEELCIAFVEQVLQKMLPEQVWQQKVEARLLQFKDAGSLSICFAGPRGSMLLTAELQKRNRVRMTCEYLQKDQDPLEISLLAALQKRGNSTFLKGNVITQTRMCA